jgi:hypothetical protein
MEFIGDEPLGCGTELTELSNGFIGIFVICGSPVA